ncbi:uncharacterized protein [Triticum aestivum]|uniref:uncharacterized protein n=1 Tax=Triticum aestivum TaxID=4565 RepID=UPI001D025C29|nr:uncharacterized protein LOC123067855 [Triticum aestivum]
MSQEPEHEAVAAAPGEALLALATRTRVKEDPTFPETLPAVQATATEDWSKWSTLPGDLVRRIADSFLATASPTATNDVDYYMCFRAVCPSWRAATDDPDNNTSDGRFRPLVWIILDEDFQGDGRRVLLNTFTGRILRKKLSTLLDYYVVGTSAGFFVLADRSPPHAARVFNPLTGYVHRFAAPVPPDVAFSNVISSDGSLLLFFFCDSSRKIHRAATNDEHFSVSLPPQASYDIIRKLVVVDTKTGTLLLPLESINRFAIFIGNHRCLALDTHIFPSIEANCVYFTEHLDSSAHICKCNIKDREAERISEAADFVKQDKKFVLVGNRPFTLIQLLSSYTINRPDSQLALQHVP